MDKACLGGLGTKRPCPKAAVTERTVDGLVFTLCADHARELDEETQTAPPKKQRRRRLNLEQPLQSLLEAASLSKAELARRRGVERGAVQSAVRAGPRISLDVLRAYAEWAGLDLVLSVRERHEATTPKKPRRKKSAA